MRRHLALLTAFAVLALGIVASLLIARAWTQWQHQMPPAWLIAVLAGVLAMVMGWRLLPTWWRGVLLVAPLVMWGGLQIHPGWFLAAAVLLLLVQFNAIRHRVPLYRSGPAVIGVLDGEIRQRRIRHLADVGCGDGHVIAALARRFPEVQFTGFETAPLLFVIARWRCRDLPNCRVRFRDFWGESWNDKDAIFAFLSPEPMLRLWRKCQRELPSEGGLYSLAFEVPGVEFGAVIPAGRFDLYFYPRLPRQKRARGLE
ncbi:MAG: class I SAM-dependent methyltransferase [Guyparkeria sp.]|uniref:class I SAM-dependent methyltransferase n=1 Tax=Guyparkeria sp. TaxID=2035736 RepID=UPI00397D64A6